MVIYMTSTIVSPPALLYMGADKFENEDLIRWGWPEDVWFHVDNLSSAHVYLRLNPGQTLDDVSSDLIDECAQLVKANSIMGCKQNNVDVVYTMWSNLKKTGDMVVGQIGYHNEKDVKKVTVLKKNNIVINRLNKTKVVKTPDLRAEREDRDRKEREAQKRLVKEQKETEKKDAKVRDELAQLKSFSSLMKEENMKTNAENDEDSDEFM